MIMSSFTREELCSFSASACRGVYIYIYIYIHTEREKLNRRSGIECYYSFCGRVGGCFTG